MYVPILTFFYLPVVHVLLPVKKILVASCFFTVSQVTGNKSIFIWPYFVKRTNRYLPAVHVPLLDSDKMLTDPWIYFLVQFLLLHCSIWWPVHTVLLWSTCCLYSLVLELFLQVSENKKTEQCIMGRSQYLLCRQTIKAMNNIKGKF